MKSENPITTKMFAVIKFKLSTMLYDVVYDYDFMKNIFLTEFYHNMFIKKALRQFKPFFFLNRKTHGL